MKILYIVNQYPSVSHTFIRREIREIERQGHDVVRIGIRPTNAALPDPIDQQEVENTFQLLGQSKKALLQSAVSGIGGAIGSLPGLLGNTMKTGMRSPKGVIRHGFYLAEAYAIADRIKDQGIDHIHAHFGTNSARVAQLVAKLTNIPFSFTVHGPEEFDDPAGHHLAAMANDAKAVIAISSFGRSQLMRWIPFEQWSKIRIVHCGLDFDQWSYDGPSPKEAPLLFIGRLGEQKGAPLLISALAELKRQGHCPDLDIVGDGDLRSLMEAEVHANDLSSHVRFLGYISSDDVRKKLIQSSALIVPSFAEGLPVVIMEAMAAGTPVLSTWVNGIPELIKNGATGFLVAPGDVNALADGMSAIGRLPEADRSTLADAARKRVFERHDIETEVTKLLDIFGEE